MAEVTERKKRAEITVYDDSVIEVKIDDELLEDILFTDIDIRLRLDGNKLVPIIHLIGAKNFRNVNGKVFKVDDTKADGTAYDDLYTDIELYLREEER